MRYIYALMIPVYAEFDAFANVGCLACCVIERPKAHSNFKLKANPDLCSSLTAHSSLE